MSDWRRRIDAPRASEIVQRVIRAHDWPSDHQSLIVHDLDLLEERFESMQRSFPVTATHAIAVKANPLIELLRPLVERGAGLEVASREEAHLALAAGASPRRIVYDSPAKTPDDLRWALATGLTVNADNLEELRRIVELPAHPGARVGIRVKPGVAEGSIAMTSVGGAGSRFGISVDQVMEDVVPLIRSHPIIQGLHVHVGSQGVALDVLVDAVRIAADLRAQICEAVDGSAISFIDIGGGLTTDYGDASVAPTIEDYAAALRARVPELFDGSLDVLTEFGRALLAGTAIAATRVEYVKSGATETVVVGHLGADFLLRPAYVPDRWSHRFSILDADGDLAERQPVSCTVAGPLCFAGDVIGRSVALPDPRPGDVLIIHDVGAYTLSMWSRHCSRGIPPVLAISDRADAVTLLRRGETPEDIVAFWSRGD